MPAEDWLTVIAQHGSPPVAIGTRLFSLTQVANNWLSLQQGRPTPTGETSRLGSARTESEV
ncbi:MAG TPA: hypothetical protein VNL35_04070 [Chloroflexota bacterium]|nr:hypothetical protein [Chloroflexota bacterium]